MSADATTGFESWLVKTPERMADSEIPWLDWQQRSARERVRAHGIPHAKQEEWRYTSLKALLEQEFVQSGEIMTALQLEDLEEILIPGFDTHRVVLVNGRYVSELSALGVLPSERDSADCATCSQRIRSSCASASTIAWASVNPCFPRSTPPDWMMVSSSTWSLARSWNGPSS